MTKQQLQKILTELRDLPGETEIVEFKEAKSNFDFDKLGKYFSALSNEANLKGEAEAWLLFGIENKHRTIVGSNYRAGDRAHLDSLKSEVANKTTHRITFIEIYELTEPEGRVVMLQIPAAPAGLPVAWDGHYYGRDGESLAPLNIEEIERIRRQGVQQDWSAEICPEATIKDLSKEKIVEFIERARANRGFPLAVNTPIKKVLTHLQLMKGEELCNAAVLAFGKNPQQYFTTAITKCAHFHGVSAQKPIPDQKVFHGDVFEQADKAKDFVLSKIALSVGTRDQGIMAPIHYEIPQGIISESIVNAIVHRDYTSKASVQVTVFSDRLTIFNPGGLTSLLSVGELKKEHGSFPTNPKLAELMYQAGYIERYGTGTEEIFKLAKKAKLKEPALEVEQKFTLTIWRPRADTTTVPQQHGNSTATVPQQYRNSVEINNLIMVLDGEMNRAQLQDALNLKHKVSFIQNYIQPALGEGMIELTIPDKPNSPKQRYRLTPKGLSLKKGTDAI